MQKFNVKFRKMLLDLRLTEISIDSSIIQKSIGAIGKCDIIFDISTSHDVCTKLRCV